MSFHDLPDDWSERPLTDPALVTDVLDLVGAIGRRGSVLVAVARPAGLTVRPSDLAWRSAVEQVCRDEGVRLLGVHLVTIHGSREVVPDAAAA